MSELWTIISEKCLVSECVKNVNKNSVSHVNPFPADTNQKVFLQNASHFCNVFNELLADDILDHGNATFNLSDIISKYAGSLIIPYMMCYMCHEITKGIPKFVKYCIYPSSIVKYGSFRYLHTTLIILICVLHWIYICFLYNYYQWHFNIEGVSNKRYEWNNFSDDTAFKIYQQQFWQTQGKLHGFTNKWQIADLETILRNTIVPKFDGNQPTMIN